VELGDEAVDAGDGRTVPIQPRSDTVFCKPLRPRSVVEPASWLRLPGMTG
jgi:hypothetical protein